MCDEKDGNIDGMKDKYTDGFTAVSAPTRPVSSASTD
jgi:hypothetical protein